MIIDFSKAQLKDLFTKAGYNENQTKGLVSQYCVIREVSMSNITIAGISKTPESIERTVNEIEKLESGVDIIKRISRGDPKVIEVLSENIERYLKEGKEQLLSLKK